MIHCISCTVNEADEQCVASVSGNVRYLWEEHSER